MQTFKVLDMYLGLNMVKMQDIKTNEVFYFTPEVGVKIKFYFTLGEVFTFEAPGKF